VSYGSWGDQEWTPGFALSPDGRQIAVYDDRTNRVTLVDAQRMRIQRVESVSRPEGLIGQVAQLLGIEPAGAWAKGVSSGADLQMRYSPDGKLLYVTGDETLPHARVSETWIGIRAIDVAHGTITGDSLKGRLIPWLQPAPDGKALYAFAPFGDDAEVFPCILRLDPTTLRIVTQQVVTLRSGNPQYYLLAAARR
jgi:hypothetical protein